MLHNQLYELEMKKYIGCMIFLKNNINMNE